VARRSDALSHLSEGAGDHCEDDHCEDDHCEDDHCEDDLMRVANYLVYRS
jgi:hypothetical protein